LEAGQIKTVIERALVSFTGQATADGNAGGTTIVCSALPTTRDFDGQKVIIADGACAGQARDIDGATTGGTITVTPALSAKIVAGVNFYITTDLPMTEEAALITAELAKVPKSDAAVSWNATALAAINAEVDTSLDTAVPGSPTANSINERVKTLDDNYTSTRAPYLDELAAANLPADIDTIIAELAGAGGITTFPASAVPANGVSLAEVIREIYDDVLVNEQKLSGGLVLKQATFTGSLANAGSATIAALDALGGAMKDIKIKIWISGATAGAGITPGWFVTRYGAPVIFVEQTVPSLGAQHTLAAAVVEGYNDVGDLPDGLQGELRIASAGNDSGLTFEATITYLQ